MCYPSDVVANSLYLVMYGTRSEASWEFGLVKDTLLTMVDRIPKIEKHTRDKSCRYSPEEFRSKEVERLFTKMPG
jgi:hypothetical protein